MFQVILYKEDITVYQLAGFRLRFSPNFSDPTLKAANSKNYTWTVDDLGNVSTYKWRGPAGTPETFYSYYKNLITPLVITKSHHSLIRYTAQRSNSGEFISGTAILRVGGKPKYNTIPIMKAPKRLRMHQSAINWCTLQYTAHAHCKIVYNLIKNEAVQIRESYFKKTSILTCKILGK